MLSGRDVVLIASIDWDFIWQGPQEIAARLARAGNRVLYVENTGVRAPRLRDAGRAASRLGHWLRVAGRGGVREAAPGVHVVSPLVLPPFGPLPARLLNRAVLLRGVVRAARRLGFRDPLVWTFLPTDTAEDLIAALRGPGSVVVYYCVADFDELTDRRDRLRAAERRVVRAADVLFVQNDELGEKHAREAPRSHVFPYGVSLAAFPDGEAVVTRVAAAPVVGYVGGLHRHVDLDLLERAAGRTPEWSWVLVGPVQTDVARLRGLPNVHLVGAQPHAALAGYIRAFDACIVPYAQNAYTATVVPTKLNEYLALGKPVVATELPSVSAFEAEHGVLRVTPNDPEAFVAALREALAEEPSAAVQAHRRGVAGRSDWGARLEAMSAIVEQVTTGRAAPRTG